MSYFSCGCSYQTDAAFDLIFPLPILHCPKFILVVVIIKKKKKKKELDVGSGIQQQQKNRTFEYVLSGRNIKREISYQGLS